MSDAPDNPEGPDQDADDIPDFPPLPGFGENAAESGRKKRLSPFLPRRFVRSLASRRIRLEDREQTLSDDDLKRIQKEVHTPWEDGSEAGKKKYEPPYFLLSLIAAVLGTGLYFLITSKETEPPPPAAPPSLPSFDEAQAGEQIAAAVKTLSEATDLDTVLGVVRNPDRLKAKIEAYYRTHPFGARPVRNVTTDPNSTLHSELGVLVMRTTVLFDDFGERIAVVEWRDGDVKVDWEHWVHYNPIRVADFIAPTPAVAGDEFEFRLAGRAPADHRNSPVFPEETHASFLFRDERDNGDEFVAYVRRGTEAHARLASYLVETTPRALIVRLLRHEAAGGPAFEVVEFVTDGWVRSTW